MDKDELIAEIAKKLGLYNVHLDNDEELYPLILSRIDLYMKKSIKLNMLLDTIKRVTVDKETHIDV